VLLAGNPRVSLAGSEYQHLYGELAGVPEPLDLQAEATLIHFLAQIAPYVSLLHDCAEGGLAVALAECALVSGIGADVELSGSPAAWFGEGGGRAIVACAAEFAETLRGVPLRRLGVVGGDTLLGHSLAELQEAHG
jgi:phosphoribosylformylglycinamidine synthase subunit PurL